MRLLLWDIGGQAQFQKLRTVYFKGSNAGIGVFDLSNPQTLLKIPGWISSLKKSVKKQIEKSESALSRHKKKIRNIKIDKLI